MAIAQLHLDAAQGSLTTGPVVLGAVDSGESTGVTAHGDIVNLAARLQDLTKEFKWPLLISQSTYDQIKGEFDAEFAESRLVKGKTIPVGIYRVLGKKNAPEAERVRG